MSIIVRPKVKTGELFSYLKIKENFVISVENDELYYSPLNASFI